MKAIHCERYGPEHLVFTDVPAPEVGDDQVLVRVHASSVNPAEWYEICAPPFLRLLNRQLRRPKDPRVGTDVAGTVEAVGKDVVGIRPGDEVFGSAKGSWAEYAVNTVDHLTIKPGAVTFEDAAAVPIAGMTALMALRDVGKVQPGEQVLINGASGGVGTYAVQVAKALGAQVTGVCSTGKVELARSLGADEVVDYTKDDFTALDRQFDVLIDIAGSRSFLACRRVLTANARVVVVGAPMSASLLGPLKHIAGMYLLAIGRSQTVKFFVAKIGTDDLAWFAERLSSGAIRTVVDRRFELAGATDAVRYLGEGHASGKVVLAVRS